MTNQVTKMTNLKHIEWHGGISAHRHQQRRRTQRGLVEASLLRCAPAGGRRWDERTGLEYRNRAR